MDTAGADTAQAEAAMVPTVEAMVPTVEVARALREAARDPKATLEQLMPTISSISIMGRGSIWTGPILAATQHAPARLTISTT